MNRVSGNSVAAPLLQRFDPRLRIISLLLLSFSISAMNDLRTVPVLLAMVIFFWIVSGVPFEDVLRRLRYPSLIVVMLILFLPFAGGQTPLIEFGWLTVSREGTQAALLIAARFYCILILAVLFLGCTSTLANIRALQSLGVPYILVDMALLMVRYLEVLKQDLQRMRRSMLLRGGMKQGSSWKNAGTLLLLSGNLLLRSYERAQGIYTAMRLRGYGQLQTAAVTTKTSRFDHFAFILTIVMAITVGWLG